MPAVLPLQSSGATSQVVSWSITSQTGQQYANISPKPNSDSEDGCFSLSLEGDDDLAVAEHVFEFWRNYDGLHELLANQIEEKRTLFSIEQIDELNVIGDATISLLLGIAPNFIDLVLTEDGSLFYSISKDESKYFLEFFLSGEGDESHCDAMLTYKISEKVSKTIEGNFSTIKMRLHSLIEANSINGSGIWNEISF